jgi:hypothetical protein
MQHMLVRLRLLRVIHHVASTLFIVTSCAICPDAFCIAVLRRGSPFAGNPDTCRTRGSVVERTDLFLVRMQVPKLLQCTPVLNPKSNRVTVDLWGAPLPGVYRGFCLWGKPEGRGQWIADEGHAYIGDWRGGRPHSDGSGKFTYHGALNISIDKVHVNGCVIN